MKIRLLILLMLFPAVAMGQFSTPSEGTGGLDSAETMQVIRDTTYVDSALVGQIISDSTVAGGLDSAEIMIVIRDTTYVDSALVGQIITDSLTTDVYPIKASPAINQGYFL